MSLEDRLLRAAGYTQPFGSPGQWVRYVEAIGTGLTCWVKVVAQPSLSRSGWEISVRAFDADSPAEASCAFGTLEAALAWEPLLALDSAAALGAHFDDLVRLLEGCR